MNERETVKSPACWKGYTEAICEEHGVVDWWDLPDGAAVLEDDGYPLQATCLLPENHGGPHEWTRDAEIVVEFTP